MSNEPKKFIEAFEAGFSGGGGSGNKELDRVIVDTYAAGVGVASQSVLPWVNQDSKASEDQLGKLVRIL